MSMFKKTAGVPGSGRTMAAVAGFLGLAAVLAMYMLVRDHERDRLYAMLELHAQRHAEVLRGRMEHTFVLDEAAQSLMSTHSQTGPAEFTRFVESLSHFEGEYQALEWVPRVEHFERDAFELWARRHVDPSFVITERGPDGSMVPAARRDVYYPVTFVVPLQGNEAALGFDLGSNPVRLEALERARRLREIVVSERVVLVQEKGSQSAVLAFAPVFRGSRFLGLSLGVYRMGDLVRTALPPGEDIRLAYRLRDLAAPRERQLLHESNTISAEQWERAEAQGLVVREMVKVPGRLWALEFAPTGEFQQQHLERQSVLVLVLGFLTTALLVLYLLHRAGVERLQREARLAADEANRSKSRFLANMSHELRTPLNGVLGMLQLLELTQTSREQAEYISLARSTGAKLQAIIDELLNLARIEAGVVELASEPFQLRRMLDSLMRIFDPMARDKGVQLGMEAGPDLPEQVVGDEVRLHQILSNLIGNALKFTARGSVVLRVRAAECADDERCRLVFEVADTGPGIPEEKLPSIFEEFVQAGEHEGDVVRGAGLGLSIAKRLAGLMDGSLTAASRVGEGTTMRLELTLRRAEGGARMAPAVSEIPLAGCRVLLVEDDEPSRLAASGMLRRAGAEVVELARGDEAVEEVRRTRYDCVVLDIRLPGLGGDEVARNIRAYERAHGMPPVPIVALTAHAMSEDRQGILEAGADRLLTKPVERERLLETVARLTSCVLEEV